MDGVHDLGGLHGFGSVAMPDGDLVSHEPWEVRSQFVGLISGGVNRAAIEALPPATYLASGYYERWFLAAEANLLRTGVVDADELAAWRARFEDDPDAHPPVRHDPAVVELIRGIGPHQHDPSTPARFAVGDRVRVRRMRPEQHHRCPRYVRGAVGEVERVCGGDPVPGLPPEDTTVETTYTVRFASVDLFGERPDEPPHVVLIDLWERYLEAP